MVAVQHFHSKAFSVAFLKVSLASQLFCLGTASCSSCLGHVGAIVGREGKGAESLALNGANDDKPPESCVVFFHWSNCLQPLLSVEESESCI